MTTKEKFSDFLNKKVGNTTISESELIAKRKNQWIKKVDFFYKKVRGYLKDYDDKMEFEIREHELFEEGIGGYLINSLIVKIKDDRHTTILFEPKGTFAVGAFGRIDMIGNYGKTHILLVKKDWKGFDSKNSAPYLSAIPEKVEWKIMNFPEQMAYLKLTEDEFLNAFADVGYGEKMQSSLSFY